MTAEEYIKAYTRGNSNELVGGGYHEWLTPENALAAVELAREEMKKGAIDAVVVKPDYQARGVTKSIRLQIDDDAIACAYDKGEKVKVIIIKE